MKEPCPDNPIGFVFGCPKCVEVPKHFETEEQLQSHIDAEHTAPDLVLDDTDYTGLTSKCSYCGETLEQPHRTIDKHHCTIDSEDDGD